MLVCFNLGWSYWLARQPDPEPIEKPPVRCAECGGEMQLTGITDGLANVIVDNILRGSR